MLYVGFVGLPNVGKSTLFNALIKNETESQNYIFATLEPAKGVVTIEDSRLIPVAKLENSKKITPTTIEFVDLPGLVYGASKGEGLGNQFLGSIRNVDAIAQIIRCFFDNDILHVNNKIDAIEDLQTIELELNYADYEVVTKRIERLHKKITVSGTALEKLEYSTLVKVEEALTKNIPIRNIGLSLDELNSIKSYNFLSQKPMLYVANIAEEELTNPFSNPEYKKLVDFAAKQNINVVAICAQLEHDMISFSEEEKDLYLAEYNLKEAGLKTLINEAYSLLGLKTFITFNPNETRAWAFKDGMTAKECAGLVHTDFERGFIRAETVSYNDLVSCGTYQKCKEAGKVRLEGRDYLVKDGDILLFRYNV